MLEGSWGQRPPIHPEFGGVAYSSSRCIAFSTAVRARGSRRSISGRFSAPASTAVRNASRARSASSSAIVSSRERMSSVSAIVQSLVDQLDRVSDRGSPVGEVDGAARVGRRDDRGTGPGHGLELAIAYGTAELLVHRRVRATGATTEPVVIELHQPRDVRREDGAHVLVGSLHVA